MTPDFRCADASLDDGETLAGTAPTDAEWLFVEQAGAWGRKAVAESPLPVAVVEHLESLADVRVQLVRRHGGVSGPGVRVFAASFLPGAPARVRTAVLDTADDLPTLADGDLTAYDEPLWMVCTNGRRDVCCAEVGRPVAAALAARWPEATWETTHLGGHRFAGTLLALPSGLVLGRLDPESAVTSCAAIEAGTVPLDASRGRAGWPAAAQYADLRLRAARSLTALDDVALVGVDGDAVTLTTPTGETVMGVRTSQGQPRRQSCADLKTKAAPVFSLADG